MASTGSGSMDVEATIIVDEPTYTNDPAIVNSVLAGTTIIPPCKNIAKGLEEVYKILGTKPSDLTLSGTCGLDEFGKCDANFIKKLKNKLAEKEKTIEKEQLAIITKIGELAPSEYKLNLITSKVNHENMKCLQKDQAQLAQAYSLMPTKKSCGCTRKKRPKKTKKVVKKCKKVTKKRVTRRKPKKSTCGTQPFQSMMPMPRTPINPYMPYF
jgi:hypothetical protein